MGDYPYKAPYDEGYADGEEIAGKRIAELEADNQRLRELVGEMLSAWDQAGYFDSDKYRRRFLQITA